MPDTPVMDRSGVDGSSASEEPANAVARRSSWQLLGHRDFCLYFVGSLGSNLGTWLQNTVQVLLAYQFTHSAFYVGLVVSAQFAGALFLSPWAAVLASRIGARRTLVGTQCISAAVAVIMGMASRSGMLDEQVLVVGASCLGVVFALAIPVQTALVPTLVPEADIESAMAMNQVSYNSGRALAPALAVLVIAFIGPNWIFGINAASFALFAILLSALKWGSCSTRTPSTLDAWDSRERVRVADGIRVARRSRRLLLLLAIVAAVTLADDPIQVLSPGVAHILHLRGTWAAYFIAALGWGIVLGSLPPVARRKAANPSHASRRAAWSLLALALSVIVFATARSPVLSLFGAFAAGVAGLFTGAATQALIVGTHRRFAASVAGLWAVAWAGTKPIASLLDGFLGSRIGILPAVIVLVFPAAGLALCELTLPPNAKKRIKAWSLSEYLESKPPSLHTQALFFVHAALQPFHPETLPEEVGGQRAASMQAADMISDAVLQVLGRDPSEMI
jgi:predicted MFS family arabinose efflux permease